MMPDKPASAHAESGSWLSRLRSDSPGPAGCSSRTPPLLILDISYSSPSRMGSYDALLSDLLRMRLKNPRRLGLEDVIDCLERRERRENRDALSDSSSSRRSSSSSAIGKVNICTIYNSIIAYLLRTRRPSLLEEHPWSRGTLP